MKLSALLLATSLLACVDDTSVDAPTVEARVVAPTREHITGDIYRYRYDLRVGTGPNAVVRIHRVVRERAPWVPRATTGAVALMHGDFATFRTNFDPDRDGMATWLAARGLDVWGIDRRWTTAPLEGADLSDFGAMGIAQELADISAALTFVRATRLATGGSLDRVNLAGFSRGGELAYFYASQEALRPAVLRHVKGIVPLDVYASLAPGDETERQMFCQLAAAEYDQLAAGEVDVPNQFFIETGELALTDPDGESPYAPFYPTNRDVLLSIAAETYFGFAPSPFYHLAGPMLGEDGLPTGLRYSTETRIATWFANAAPHQSLRESADTDALTCGEGPLPVDVPLSRIRVPVLLIAAAGGYGERALHSTTQVSSTDVTTLVIRRRPAGEELEDYGHGDLLFASDAPRLVWQPLLDWLRAH